MKNKATFKTRHGKHYIFFKKYIRSPWIFVKRRENETR